jgi:DNA-binding XRE family transcriptional regulator
MGGGLQAAWRFSAAFKKLCIAWPSLAGWIESVRRRDHLDASRGLHTFMARRKKIPEPPLVATPILSDELVRLLGECVAAKLGPEAMALATQHGVRVTDVIRFQSVRQHFVAAREKKGLQLKEAAQRLGVPRYRINDIESGLFNSIRPDIMRRYLEFLGLSSWYAEWALSNRELANRIDERPAKSADPV